MGEHLRDPFAGAVHLPTTLTGQRATALDVAHLTDQGTLVALVEKDQIIFHLGA
jgi:hypothetical protein